MSSTETLLFNYSQKMEYVKYEGLNDQALINYFKRTYKGESEHGKDLADMNEEELKDTLIALNIRSETSRGHLISLMRGYVNWAQLSGKANGNNAINKITAESIASRYAMVTQMLKDPQQVRDILKIAIRHGYDSLENRATRDSLVFWLLYSGMFVEELQALKKRDVDLENRMIKCENGREYPIEDDFLPLITRCLEITYIERFSRKTEMVVDAPPGSPPKRRALISKLMDNEYLFKPIQGTRTVSDLKCTLQSFYNIVYRILNEYSSKTNIELSLTPLNIRFSGMFYKLYMMEQKGLKVTYEVVANHMGIEYADRVELLNKVRRWYLDYGDWKLAFDYM